MHKEQVLTSHNDQDQRDVRDRARRTLLHRFACTLLFATPVGAGARSPRPPPLEDYIKRADIVFLGRIEKLVFRSVSSLKPEDFGRDFDSEEPPYSRTTDVYAQPRIVLHQAASAIVPPVIRISVRVPEEERGEIIGSYRIFIVVKYPPYKRPDGTLQEIYRAILPPLPVESQSQVGEAIKKISATGN